MGTFKRRMCSIPVNVLLLSASLMALCVNSQAYAAIDGIPSESYDDYDEATHQQLAHEAIAARETSLAAWYAAQVALQSAIQRVRDIRSEISSLQSRIAGSEQEVVDLNAAIADNEWLQNDLAQKITSREATIRDLDHEISQTQARISQIETRFRRVRKVVRNEKSKLSQLQQQSESAWQARVNAKAALDQNVAAISNLETKIAEHQSKIQQTEERRSNLQTKLQRQQAALADKQLKIQTARQNRQKALAKRDKLKARVEGLTTKKAKADQRLQQVKAKAQQARQALQAAQQKRQAARAALDKNSGKIEELKSAIARHQAKIQTLTANRSQLQTRVENQKAKLNQAKAEVSQLRQRKQQQEQRIQKLTAKIQNLKAKRKRARQNGKEEKVKELTQQIKDRQAKRNQFEAKLQKTQQKIQAAKANIQKHERNITKFQAKIEQGDQQIQVLQQKTRNKQQRLAKVKGNTQNLKQALQVARTKQQNAQTALDAAQVKVALVQQRVDDLTQRLQARRTDLQATRQRVKKLKTRIQNLEAKVQEYRATIADIKTKLPNMADRIARLRQKIQNKRQRLQSRRLEQPGLRTNLQAATQRARAARQAVADQEPVVAKARERLRKIRQRLHNTNARLVSLQDSRTNEVAAVAGLRRRADSASSRRNTLQASLASEQSRLAGYRDLLIDSQAQLPRVQSARAQRRSEMDLAQADLDAKRAEAEVREARVAEVQRYIRLARERMSVVASAHGNQDGDKEGRFVGAEEGERDGRAQGAADGSAAGTVEGKKRDYELGYTEGKKRGTNEGRAEATTKAEEDGLVAGSREGRTDGLKVALANGKTDGLTEGETNGSDQVAYQSGYTEGSQRGISKATKDAAPKEQEGYEAKEQEFRNAPLENVVLKTGFAGLQASHSDSGRDLFYNPRRSESDYPHPIVFSFYIRHYSEAYRETLDRVYAKVYASTYEGFYRTLFENKRAEALAQSYPSERARGDQEAYARFYKETYDLVYAEEYAIRYQKHYDLAYAEAKVDELEYNRGFTEGNAVGSAKKGRLEGYSETYAGNIERLREEAFTRGSDRAEKLYTENPVIEVVPESLQLVDMNGDGIFMPTEFFYTKLVVKNYGLVAKDGLKSRVATRSQGIEIPNAEIDAPSVPGQSQATILGLGLGKIVANAAPSRAFAVDFALLEAGSRTTLVEDRFSDEISFPTVSGVQGFDGVLIPGVRNVLKIRVHNRSNLAQTLTVSLDTDFLIVDVEQTSAEITVPAKSYGLASFAVKSKTAGTGDFADVRLFFSVKKDAVNYAAPFTIDATLMQRHRTTPGSIGLLLSDSFSGQSTQAIYKAMLNKLDTWDMRAVVDGPISGSSGGAALAPYSKKLVVLVASETLELDRAAVVSLKDHVARGGALMVFGSQMEESRALVHFGVELGISSARTFAARGDVEGAGDLSGVAGSVDGLVAALTKFNADVLEVLKVNSEVVGTLNASGALGSNALKIGVAIGVDANALSVDTIHSIFAKLQSIGLGFDEKLAASLQDATVFGTIQGDLLREISTVDKNESTRWFSKKKKKTKIYRAIQFFLNLDENDPAAVAFTEAYDDVWAAMKRMKNSTWERKALRRILKHAWVDGNPWRSRYCRGSRNVGGDMCNSDL